MLKPIVTTLVISILTSGSLLFAQENSVIEATTIPYYNCGVE